jgi:hypothetical protein
VVNREISVDHFTGAVIPNLDRRCSNANVTDRKSSELLYRSRYIGGVEAFSACGRITLHSSCDVGWFVANQAIISEPIFFVKIGPRHDHRPVDPKMGPLSAEFINVSIRHFHIKKPDGVEHGREHRCVDEFGASRF